MFRTVHLVVSVVALTLALIARPDVGGEEGRPFHYEGQLVRPSTGPCRFSIELEPVSFVLTSVAGKYRMLRVRVENTGEELSLSSARDVLDLVLVDADHERRVRGILDLQRSDPTFWDGLDVGMREVLAYPTSIRAAKESEARRDGVVRYLYAFFPVDQVSTAPEEFELALAGAEGPIAIRRPRAAKR